MNKIKNSIPNFFRAYDVRGLYGSEITTNVAYQIGRAFCSYLGNGSNVNIAEDTRRGSSELLKYLTLGIINSGCNSIYIGKVPSPILYFSTKTIGSRAGVMITASHLPPEWNGFKFCDKNGLVISDGFGLEEIRKLYLNPEWKTVPKGRSLIYNRISKDYSSFVNKNIENFGKQFNVTVDTSNSVPSLFLPILFKKLGIVSHFINSKIMETPIHNVEPGVESMKMLSDKVIENSSNLGLMYDADGDRVAFVDEKGQVYPDGVVLIAIISNFLSSSSRGNTIVLDITCPSGLLEYLESLGLVPLISRVGHNYCSTMALRNNSLFAAQFSGHISLQESHYRDDAIYASLKLIQFVSKLEEPLSNFIKKNIPVFFYTTTAIEIYDRDKFELMREIVKVVKEKEEKVIEIDGVKVLKDGGSYLIRVSNTSNIIRIMAEGKDETKKDLMMEIAMKTVKEVMNID